MSETNNDINKKPSRFIRFKLWIIKNFLRIWYVILLISVSVYCIVNWSTVISFNPFTGDSLLLIVMVGLYLLPFLSEFEIKGVKGKFNNVLVGLADVKEKEAALEKTESQYDDEIKETDSIRDDIQNFKSEISKLRGDDASE